MALKNLSKKGPTSVYRFRYEREDGEYREITVPVGWGRLKRGKEKDALELAARRLSEQYGDMAVHSARSIKNVCLVEERPELHQNHYRLVSVTKLK